MVIKNTSDIPTQPVQQPQGGEAESLPGTYMRLGVLGLLALMLGVPGLGLGLASFNPPRSPLDLLVLLPLFYLVCGFALGIIDKEYWPLAGCIAWGPVILGLIRLLQHRQSPVLVLADIIAPILLAVLGGFVGGKTRAWLNME